MTTKDTAGPYHLVQHPLHGGKHIGPFTTRVDAMLASEIARPGWRYGTLYDNAAILDRQQFADYMAGRLNLSEIIPGQP